MAAYVLPCGGNSRAPGKKMSAAVFAKAAERTWAEVTDGAKSPACKVAESSSCRQRRRGVLIVRALQRSDVDSAEAIVDRRRDMPGAPFLAAA